MKTNLLSTGIPETESLENMFEFIPQFHKIVEPLDLPQTVEGDVERLQIGQGLEVLHFGDLGVNLHCLELLV